MRVCWYGHACFRLEGAGVSVITDPYTPDLAGLDPVTDTADLVLMSSSLDEAHSNAAMITGSPRVFNALDAVESPVALPGGIVLEAVAAMEGVDRPDDPKANALYRFELDGFAICHMGDVGRALTEAQLEPLSDRVDVLFALAGAGPTIALDDLDAAIERIGPRIVIPMHHRTPSLRYDVGPLEDFLDRRVGERIVTHDASTLELDGLPDTRTVHVLRPLLDPLAAS